MTPPPMSNGSPAPPSHLAEPADLALAHMLLTR
jgi:hypothetical protein